MTPPRNSVVYVALLILAVFGSSHGAFAQEMDVASVITAYAAALNAHDAPAALDLFDQYGSATDLGGRHFEGRDGLMDFLQASGFSTPDANVSTRNLHLVANRAVWTYTCSCVDGPLEARVVTNHGKITVFAINRPAGYASAETPARTRPGIMPWLVGLGALAFGAVMYRRRRRPAFFSQPRVQQGRLLAALRAHRAPEPASHSQAGSPPS